VCVREQGSCPQAGYLNWYGTARAKKQGLPAIYEVKRGFHDEPGVSHMKPRNKASSSSISSNASYEEEVFKSGSSVKWCGVNRKVVTEVLMCVCVCVCARARVFLCSKMIFLPLPSQSTIPQTLKQEFPATTWGPK
jgi:hypothetical protein